MSPVTVRATFLPNGFVGEDKLGYSIFISLDFSKLKEKEEITTEKICMYPEFISNCALIIMKDNNLIKGLLKPVVSGAKKYWNLIFGEGKIEVKPKTAANAKFDFIDEPVKTNRYFHNHYLPQVLKSLKNNSISKENIKYFDALELAINEPLKEFPIECTQTQRLINNIHIPDTIKQNNDKVLVSDILSYFSKYPDILEKLKLLIRVKHDSLKCIRPETIKTGDKIRVILKYLGKDPAIQTIYKEEEGKPTVVLIDKNNKLFLAQTQKPKIYSNGFLNLQSQYDYIDPNTNEPEKKPRFVIKQNTTGESSYKINTFLDGARGFANSEFVGNYQVEKLCKAMYAGEYTLTLIENANSIEWLNAILLVKDLYEQVLRKMIGKALSVELKNYKQNFDRTNDPINLKRLNRYLIKEYYPSPLPYSDSDLAFYSDELDKVNELIARIQKDKYTLKVIDNFNSIEWLNAILLVPNLYNQVLNKKGENKKTKRLESYYKTYTKLQNDDNLRRLNRCLLEEYYADETPKKASNLPPLNTNGIYLIDDLRRDTTDEYKEYPELYLENLLVGYRFDIKGIDTENKYQNIWKALNSKLTTYKFLKDTSKQESGDPKPEPDEGWTKTDTAIKTKYDGQEKELISDILCHLNGWGLNTENPLQEKAQEVKKNKKNDKTDIKNPVHDYLKSRFEVSSQSPKGSLAPLRIGHNYKLRARLVTIDGYSLSLREANEISEKLKVESDEFKFLRQESVGAPVFILREPIYEEDQKDPSKKKVKDNKKGESEYTLVIRSHDNNSRTSESTSRGLAPADISWHLAEWLGAFDTKEKFADKKLIKRSKSFLPQFEENKWKKGTGRFISNGDTRRRVPYIIDPWSQCFEILCDENKKTYSLLYCNHKDLKFWDEEFDWWNCKTWEIVVKEQRGKQSPGIFMGKTCAFSIDLFNRVITILIAKGEDLKFKTRTFPADKGKLHNGHFISNLLCQAALSSPSIKAFESREDELRKKIFELLKLPCSNQDSIREPLLLAEKEFRVIHAVKRPLFAPKFTSYPSIERTWIPEETSFALMTAKILYPGKTSKKLELIASWEEVSDEPDKSSKRISKKFEDILVDQIKLNGALHKDAVTPKYAEKWLLGDIVENDNKPFYLDTEKVFYAKHNFGDTKHRIVNYKLKATSRFIEYFPEEKENEFSISSEFVKISVPSSQAPAPPEVAFIIPYFDWEAENKGHVIRTRKGNRLRIYLKRPWFSSGKDEKLAVIISNNPSFNAEKDLSEGGYHQFISKWGRDITTYGRNLLPLTPYNSLHSGYRTDLTINNLSFKQRHIKRDIKGNTITNEIKRPFSACIYEVKPFPNEDNIQYWYADIEFSTELDLVPIHAYFPFIQLSLARYQEHSILDEELSSTILCDFIQVAPTRTVTVNKNKLDNSVEISLFGSAFKASGDVKKDLKFLQNEAYVCFLPKEESITGHDTIIYKSVDDKPTNSDDKSKNITWHKLTDITVLENGIVWRYKGFQKNLDDYKILIKEFETFSNKNEDSSSNPEKDPSRRLTFGDAIGI